MKIRVWVLVALAVILAACGRANVNVQREPGGGVSVTVTLSEADINAVVAEALDVANPLLREPQIDLQSGAIVISGEHELASGQRVSGTVTLTLSVQDGGLLAQTTAVNIEGVDLSDERVARLNAQLAAAFQRRAARDNPVITMTSVTITDSQIEFVFLAEGNQ